jgi:hypothetical protein
MLWEPKQIEWSFLSKVGRSRDIATTTGPVGVDPGTGLLEELISVSTKVITLSLEKVSGELLVTKTIIEVKSSGKCRGGDTKQDSVGNDSSP